VQKARKRDREKEGKGKRELEPQVVQYYRTGHYKAVRFLPFFFTMRFFFCIVLQFLRIPACCESHSHLFNRCAGKSVRFCRGLP
jgi:hypothetical protein